MSGKNILWIMKNILWIMKTILLIVKIILLIVGLETGYAERSRKCQEIELAHIAERSQNLKEKVKKSACK